MKKVGKSIKVYFIGMIIGGITLGLTTVVADTIINSINVSYKTSTVKAALDDLYGLTADDIWQKIYPIGSIYTSVSPTSPATLFGGTWEEFGEGQTLVGVKKTDSDFDTVEKTGGSKTKTIAVENLPAHSHSVNINTNSTNHNHGTINSTGAGGHTHTVTDAYWQMNYPKSSSFTWNTASAGAGTDTNISNKTTTRNTSNPGNHTHQVTINNSGGHTHNVNGNTGNIGSGTALDVQNPYITVYMWKRTA